MKRGLLIGVLCALVCMCAKPTAAAPRKGVERDSLSYVLGLDLGYTLSEWEKQSQVAIFPDDLFDGVKAGIANVTTGMTQEDARTWLLHYVNTVVPEKNEAASEAWLAEVATRPGVQKTESGLLYRIDEPGDTSVMATSDYDKVKVNYVGRFRNGNDFDKNNEIEFALNHVIKGWAEGIKLVGKGGKITLWIPSELAYGRHGSGGVVPGNSALEFEVELLDVTPEETYYREETVVAEEEEPRVIDEKTRAKNEKKLEKLRAKLDKCETQYSQLNAQFEDLYYDTYDD